MDDYDFGELVVLQHDREVHLGAIEPMLAQRATRRPWRLVDLGADDALPDLHDGIRGVLVLGGFGSVVDAQDDPAVAAELAFLRQAKALAIPVLGICLGAQLLAAAHGGEVTRRAGTEAGLFRLRSVDADDPVAAGWPEAGLVVLSHDDEVTTLPPGATPLLEAAGDPSPDGVPAWRIGEHVHALQFHPEADPGLLQGWLDASLHARATAAGVDTDALMADVTAAARFIRSTGLAAVGRWLDGVVGKGDPSPRKHRKAA